MSLKKRRIELHTSTDQLLVSGGDWHARVPFADCAERGAAPGADEAAAGVKAREIFRRIESGGAPHAEGEVSKEGEVWAAPSLRSQGGGRLGILRDAARSLSRAMKVIRAMEITGTSSSPDVERGINFYDEVRRFEIHLIERALWHSGGSQVRAASLLGLKTTTFNSKLKVYNINSKGPELTGESGGRGL